MRIYYESPEFKRLTGMILSIVRERRSITIPELSKLIPNIPGYVQLWASVELWNRDQVVYIHNGIAAVNSKDISYSISCRTRSRRRI